MKSWVGLLAAMSMVLSAVACAHRTIAGTDLDDTPDNLAILKLVKDYKDAVERRDAPAVLKLLSKSYYDTRGTPDPADDYDYNGLAKTLGDEFQQVSQPALDVDVRKIEVLQDDAKVKLYFSFRYQTADAGPNGGFKNHNDPDLMVLKREEGTWKIVSGI